MKKTKVMKLDSAGKARFTASLEGPQVKAKDGLRPALLPLTLEVTDEGSATLTAGDQKLKLTLGTWSPVFEIKFKAGFAFTVHAVTQVILTELKNRVSLYFVPLQIHPLHALWHYATPPGMVKEAWRVSGGYLTLGWPQDTNALEDGCINDEQFISLRHDFQQRKRSSTPAGAFGGGTGGDLRQPGPRTAHVHAHNPTWCRLVRAAGRFRRRARGASGNWARHRLLILSDHGFKHSAQSASQSLAGGNGYTSWGSKRAGSQECELGWADIRWANMHLNVANPKEGRMSTDRAAAAAKNRLLEDRGWDR
jgi:hypothetical protein